MVPGSFGFTRVMLFTLLVVHRLQKQSSWCSVEVRVSVVVRGPSGASIASVDGLCSRIGGMCSKPQSRVWACER